MGSVQALAVKKVYMLKSIKVELLSLIICYHPIKIKNIKNCVILLSVLVSHILLTMCYISSTFNYCPYFERS